MHRNEAGIDPRAHVRAVVEKFVFGAIEQLEVFRMRPLLPIAFADQHVPTGFRPCLELTAHAGHSARDASSSQHDGQMECLRIGLEFADIDVVEMQLRERTGPVGAFPRGVEHHR